MLTDQETSQATFRLWCSENGYEDLAGSPTSEWDTDRLKAAMDHYNAMCVVVPGGTEQDAPRPEDQTFEARVRDDFDRAAGTLAGMTKRLAMRVMDLRARDGNTAAVRRFGKVVMAMAETTKTILDAVGNNNSITVDKLLEEARNHGTSRTAKS